MIAECEFTSNKQKHQIDKNFLRQDHHFSTRLPFVNNIIREIYYPMAKSTYNSSEDMINKLQKIKG